MSLRSRQDYRRRRHWRVRKKVAGNGNRPRMSIMVSGRHMYVQFIDDDAGVTMASASTLGADTRGSGQEAAFSLGERAARVALEAGIADVVVDRGGFSYHGKVRKIVEGALSAGLKVGRAAVPETDAGKDGAEPDEDGSNKK